MTFWPEASGKMLRPLKRTCSLNPDVLPESTDPGLEFDYVDIGNVSLESGVTDRVHMTFASAPSRARKLVRSDDIIVSTVRTYLKAVACIGEDAEHLVVSTGFAVLRAKPESEPRFLYSVVQSHPFVEGIVAASSGVSYPAINPSTLGDLSVPLPDLPTQKAIADFLDRETARIDQLIEKKQRMVEVLGEREENNVVETIEHIFAESRAWKISHVCALKRGRFNQRPRNAPEFYDGDFPFLQTSDVAQAKKYISGHKQTLTDLGASVSVLFPSNSVLMAIAANVGDVAITKFDAYCPDSVIGFFPTTRLKVDYLYYALRSLRSSIATSSTSNARDNINISRLGALKIPVPKHATQDRVSRTLSVQENSTVRLVAVTHTSIERLREFRSALITAAVTGQIDVSTWGKQGTADRRLDRIEEASSP